MPGMRRSSWRKFHQARERPGGQVENSLLGSVWDSEDLKRGAEHEWMAPPRQDGSPEPRIAGPGRGWPLPREVMKAAVAVARPGPASSDKARLEGVRRGAPPRGPESQGGPAHRAPSPAPPLPGARPTEARGDWPAREGRGRAHSSPLRFFSPSLGGATQLGVESMPFGGGACQYSASHPAAGGGAMGGGAGIGPAPGLRRQHTGRGSLWPRLQATLLCGARGSRPVPLYITAWGGMGSGRRLRLAALPSRLSRATGATAAAAAASRRRPGTASPGCCQELAAEMRRWPFSEPGFPA